MTPGRERQPRYRARRRRAGTRRLDLWLDAEAQALVAELQQPGERLEAVVGRALKTLKRVTGDGPSPTKDPDAVTRDTLLLALIRLFFPDEKPMYPRRAYGLRTLPLSALNRFLARHGYVLHASKVRNADWFVACTDEAGQTELFGLFELRRVVEE